MVVDIPESVQAASFVLIVCAFLLPPSGQSQASQDLKAQIPRLEKNLRENIIPFWLKKSLDRKNGGYIVDFDAKGGSKPDATRMIVTQSRQLWLWSRLAREGYGGKEYLDAAELGFRFLRDRMWDKGNGGFYWEVDPSGTQVRKPNKHLYGQAFALYGLSEYYLASGRKEALDLATRLFGLLEEKAHDPTHGGYHEFFLPDWSKAPDEKQSYMGAPTGLKLMNTHLHLLEAISVFFRASQLPLARERLLELITIESNAVVRKGLIACTDKFDPDWKPRLEGEFARVSYGHDIENVWLLMDACDAAGVPYYTLLDLFRGLWDYSLKYGYDETGGGFFDSGAFNKPADNRAKVWWVQAEAIVSALYMYRATGEPKYFSLFKQTYDFIEKRLTDWESGEWHERVLENGAGIGDKASPWKAGYHNGRSMIECLALLRKLSR